LHFAILSWFTHLTSVPPTIPCFWHHMPLLFDQLYFDTAGHCVKTKNTLGQIISSWALWKTWAFWVTDGLFWQVLFGNRHGKLKLLHVRLYYTVTHRYIPQIQFLIDIKNFDFT
jgi:hypothetical protein